MVLLPLPDSPTSATVCPALICTDRIQRGRSRELRDNYACIDKRERSSTIGMPAQTTFARRTYTRDSGVGREEATYARAKGNAVA